MEPVQKEIDIGMTQLVCCLLRRLFKILEARHVTPASQVKLLKLLIGFDCTHLEDDKGRFLKDDLLSVGKAVGYQQRTPLIEQARQSGLFYLTGKVGQDTDYILSPLLDKCAPESRTLDDIFKINSTLRSKENINDNEENINPKKDKEKEKEKKPLKNLKALLPENLKLIMDFLDRMKKDPVRYQEFYQPIVDQLTKYARYTPSWARKIAERSWELYTESYLAKNIAFLSASDTSRYYTLEGIMKDDHGKKFFGHHIGAAKKEIQKLIDNANANDNNGNERGSKNWSMPV